MAMLEKLFRSVFVAAGTLLLVSCATNSPNTQSVKWDRQWEVPAARTASRTESAQPSYAAQLPRVMLIVDEKSLGTIATSEVETMAIRKLQQLNIPTVDQDMVRSNVAKGQQLLKMAGDNRGAATLGLQFGAEVVIVGEAVAKPAAGRIANSNLRTYQAVATLRAVRTDNAATIAAASEDAGVVALEDVGGSAKSLRAAAEKTLDVLLLDIIKNWTPGTTSGSAANPFVHEIQLSAGGVDALWKLKALRENLRGRDDELRDVVQRSYTAGMAEFSVRSAMPAEELAEALVMRSPADLKVQILDVAAGKIQMRLSD